MREVASHERPRVTSVSESSQKASLLVQGMSEADTEKLAQNLQNNPRFASLLKTAGVEIIEGGKGAIKGIGHTLHSAGTFIGEGAAILNHDGKDAFLNYAVEKTEGIRQVVGGVQYAIGQILTSAVRLDGVVATNASEYWANEASEFAALDTETQVRKVSQLVGALLVGAGAGKVLSTAGKIETIGSAGNMGEMVAMKGIPKSPVITSTDVALGGVSVTTLPPISTPSKNPLSHRIYPKQTGAVGDLSKLPSNIPQRASSYTEGNTVRTREIPTPKTTDTLAVPKLREMTPREVGEIVIHETEKIADNSSNLHSIGQKLQNETRPGARLDIQAAGNVWIEARFKNIANLLEYAEEMPTQVKGNEMITRYFMKNQMDEKGLRQIFVQFSESKIEGFKINEENLLILKRLAVRLKQFTP